MNIDATLRERQKTHGDYRDHARVTQSIMDIMLASPNWSRLSPSQRESIHMFAHKMGRIAVGDPDVHDHWHDIAGYATLVANQALERAARIDAVEKVAEPIRRREAATRKLAVLRIIDEMERAALASGSRIQRGWPDPCGPGTPEDGGHYERQKNEND